MQAFIFIPVFFILFDQVISATWNYADLGPDVWSDTYPACAGQLQSPINIRTACTIYEPFAPFNFSSTYDQAFNFTLINNGHTIMGTYSGNDSSPFILTGGGLDGTYEFLNFHLHWGENYKSGSEHQVNGVKYAGEIHFVHINQQKSGYAVLGFFMQSSQVAGTNGTINTRKKRDDLTIENSTITEWIKYFSVAEDLEALLNSTILDLNLASLMGNNLDDFWRYEGSLTTPPCTEGIIWTMFKTPIMFTEDELNAFRQNLYFEDYRGPQPLNDRIVYRNFPEQIFSSIADYNCCSNNLNYNSAHQCLNQNSALVILFSVFISMIALKYH